MIDISNKGVVRRVATARGEIKLRKETIAAIKERTVSNREIKVTR